MPPVVDEEIPDETIPPETDETASEEPVQPEDDASVDVQAASQIIASEITTSYSYIYASGKLLQEKVTTNGATETHNFFYDNTGKPYAMQVNGTTYYYVTNLQGDVMGLVDTSGNSVASYTYDPYGKLLTATGTLAEKNPLRYRGYYYDSESGLYYLQSRYYDPATRRFVNADTYASTGQGLLGCNMFAYCNNNPIMLLDVNGFEPEWWQWLISGTMVAAGVVLVATGVAGLAGGALICAGANSMIGSYVSEASGGTTTAGWIGGGVTGALCGLGAGFSGSLLIDATTTSGATCLGYLGASEAVAFSSGFAGSLLGQLMEDGRAMRPDRLTHWFTRFVRRADLPPIHLHSIRHTYATLCIADNIPLTAVAAQLGHANVWTTAKIYAHSIQTAEASAALKIGERFDAATKTTDT